MVRSTAKRARVSKPADRERDDKYFSKVIGKALDLLAILRVSTQPLSLNELTLRVGLAKSSVFRMLHTLEVSGYIERDPSGRYLVAAGVRAWGREQLINDLLDAASGPMRGAEPRVRGDRQPGDALREPHRGRGHHRKPAVDPHGQHRRPHPAAARELARQGDHRASDRRCPRAPDPQLRRHAVHDAYDHRRSRPQARTGARARARLQHRRGGERPRRPLLRRADLRAGARSVRGAQPVARRRCASATSRPKIASCRRCAAPPSRSARRCQAPARASSATSRRAPRRRPPVARCVG